MNAVAFVMDALLLALTGVLLWSFVFLFVVAWHGVPRLFHVLRRACAAFAREL